MFDPKSRYYSLETATYITVEGRQVVYVRRRFLPCANTMPTLAAVTVMQGDRLDVITARTLGDPEHFWHLCDANNTMHPAELIAETEQTIKTIRISLPEHLP
jgi:hypothetical protein